MDKNTSLAIAIGAALLLIIGIIVWQLAAAPEPSGQPVPPPGAPRSAPVSEQPGEVPVPVDDTSRAINQDLENVNVGDLDSEFIEVDKDLQQL